MKVAVYYKTTKKPWGGTNSFVVNLENYIKKETGFYTNNPNKDVDLILINGAYTAPGKSLSVSKGLNLKKLGYTSRFLYFLNGCCKNEKKMILRLDGLRSVYAGVITPMDQIQLSMMEMVDHIIFQSKFAHDCFVKAGYNGDNFSIIHNGVNNNIFYPDKKMVLEEGKKIKIIACSWSNNVAKGHEIIADFSLLPDVDVAFIGNWNSSVDSKKVRLFPPMTHQKIAQIFRNFHFFLFPSQNESCPNILLEALSSGLPAIYSSSGANVELADNYGVPLKDDYLQVLGSMRSKYSSLRKNIFKNIDSFSIESSGKLYLSTFDKVLS